MRTIALLLIEKEDSGEDIHINLSNAKHLNIGTAPGFGSIVHIAANTPEDFEKAFLEFSKMEKVVSVVALFVKHLS